MKNKKGLIKIIVIFFSYVIFFIGSEIITSKVLHIEKNISRIISYIIILIYLSIVLKKLNKIYVLKWDKSKFFLGLKIGTSMFVFCFLFLIINLLTIDNFNFNTLSHIIYWILIYLIGAGFVEELVSRGIVLNTVWDYYECNNKKNVIFSCILSAILFGSMHIFNGVITGKILISQIFITSGIGLVLSAIYARSKSIWSVAFIHGIWDITLDSANVLFIEEILERKAIPILNQISYGLIGLIPFVLIFCYLLRKNKIEECYKK